MNKEIKISKVSKDESGKLRGGFSIQPVSVDADLGATNINCTGGGWFDTNTNCTGNCKGCLVIVDPNPGVVIP